ncbi:hypothetical protein CKM354_000087600 [Cercospora kikuchii]|uniref:Uncharacterized protein n=1 Tax=Cercospora kikuchii TaxID=84275 RepID=A0A9P3CBQ1_9PEZI|nr:uncharacterized protein CKM354_000087600 [Cercospora kikuchii]GIZ37430.1 hypothetical protein CKM354_000087600 [Cercospora kikuchii]
MKPAFQLQSESDGILVQATMTSQSASAVTGAEAEPLEEKPFPLLELPVELVLRILRFAILGSAERRAIPVTPIRRKRATEAAQPPITKACRLLRKEGLMIFCKECIFHCSGYALDLRAMCKWLAAIGPKHCSLISSIAVFLNSYYTAGSDVSTMVWGEVVDQFMTVADCAASEGLDTSRMCVLFAKGKLVLSGEELVEPKEASNSVVFSDSFQISVQEPTGTLKDGWTSLKDLLISCGCFNDTGAMGLRLAEG